VISREQAFASIKNPKIAELPMMTMPIDSKIVSVMDYLELVAMIASL
jgi:hypothetical protein